MTMRKLTLAVVALIVACALLTPTASAVTYQAWHFRNGTICYQDHGSIRWDGAASVGRWNVADVDLVTRDICTGFPRDRIIDLKTYNNPSEYACAKTASEGNAYSWVYVSKSGVKTAMWAPDKMTIWLNTAATLAPKCTATSGMRAHLLTHEIGHALGLGHPPPGSPASVMGSWSVWWPTTWDLANVNRYY